MNVKEQKKKITKFGFFYFCRVIFQNVGVFVRTTRQQINLINSFILMRVIRLIRMWTEKKNPHRLNEHSIVQRLQANGTNKKKIKQKIFFFRILSTNNKRTKRKKEKNTNFSSCSKVNK